jgi:glycerophosphoryl diester phosphodiesterase
MVRELRLGEANMVNKLQGGTSNVAGPGRGRKLRSDEEWLAEHAMAALFDLQGHRGARGLRPENTLPSFEAALDCGVTTIETDVHLTADGVPVLAHDPRIGPGLFRLAAMGAAPGVDTQPPVRSLTGRQLRAYVGDRNPDPLRFPDQDASLPALAARFARERGQEPFGVPTLEDLFAFVAAYAGAMGAEVGKKPAARRQAARARFDLELKRVPFHAGAIGDDFTGDEPALLEQSVVAAARAADVVSRTVVRSFDHRSVRSARRLEPGLTGAVLVAHTAPVSPAAVARAADAAVYCPSYEFLDAAQVCEAHAGGVRVVPWTVNDPLAWARLVEWGVDGMTTDFPDRLAAWLADRSISWTFDPINGKDTR